MNNEQILQQLIERAAADPDFKARLVTDPVAAAQSEGYDLDETALAAFFGSEAAGEAEVVEALQARVSMLGQLNANLTGPGPIGG